MTMKLLTVLCLFISLTAWAGEEKYMPNEAGGFMILKQDPCPFPEAVKQGYLFHATATEGVTPEVEHQGCWISPSIADAPKDPKFKIIPLVNLWFDGTQVSYPVYMFGDEKKRWIVTPEIEVRPEHIPNSI
jgi:hypothetical protein